MRTTSILVGGIIEVDLAIDLTPFIFSANELVTEVCGSVGYSEERLELIERYLAAHFYTLRDPRPTSERAGPVAETFQSAVTFNLYTSHYGQHAILLDTQGGLAALNKQRRRRVATVTWLGSTEAESRLRGIYPP